MLGPITVQAVNLQHRGEPAARGVPGHAHGHGDELAGPVGQGDPVFEQGRVEVLGASVEGGFVALPSDVLAGGDGAGLARGPVHAGCPKEEVAGCGEVAGGFGVTGTLFESFGNGEEGQGVGFEIVGGFEVVLPGLSMSSTCVR